VIERLSLGEAADDQRRDEWRTFRLPILAQYWATGIRCQAALKRAPLSGVE
jgi:hypothetical protein